MSRVESVIDARIAEGNGAVIGYLPLGFPDLRTSIEAAVTLAENGMDIIELGVPYSDPVMDGPVIQAATLTALNNGFRLSQLFDAIAEITSRVSAPVLVMSYWNPVMQFGVDAFSSRLAEAGGAGLITPDLVPDEASEWVAASEKSGLDRIFLAAPSSSEGRLRQAVSSSRGFVYTVSTMGITGARKDVDSAARELVSRLRAVGPVRACVGLGISSAEQVAEVLSYADGAIVGSALVRALSGGGLEELASVTADLVSGARPRLP